MTTQVPVALNERSYDIHIGSDLLDDSELLGSAIAGHQVLVVTNESIAPLYLERVQRTLARRNLSVHHVILQDGEDQKTLETYSLIIDALMVNRHERSTTIVALGGGVVGDMAGFAAATYQRGVALIQVPTTLLSQVDSSVGGKTAVNHASGKNMIGAFYQPKLVLADTTTLATLPQRELRAGLAEVIKYGAIWDVDFLGWLEDNIARLLDGDSDALVTAIARSCEIKAVIVGADERESGQRALLNFGHTFGHGIEAVAGYGRWLHGEAVATGMVLATDLSRRQGLIDPSTVSRLSALIDRAGLPLHLDKSLDAEAMLAAMSHDKKVVGGALRFVLLRQLGEAFATSDVSESNLRATLESNVR